MGKHCNNSQCFKEKKLQSKIFNQLNIKKKLTEIILEKKITKKTPKKEKKITWETL